MIAGLADQRTKMSKTPGEPSSIEMLLKRIEKLESNQAVIRIGLKEIMAELSINREQSAAIIHMLLEEGFFEQLSKAN